MFMYMSGSKEGVIENSFTAGPCPRISGLIQYLKQDNIVVQKTAEGQFVDAWQFVDNKLVPWVPPPECKLLEF
jgi:hypothetical protein